MPNIRRYGAPLRRSGSDPGEWQQFAFAHGWEKLPMAFPDEESARLAWEDHRETYLDEWAREHPGTRPYAWWKFDAPEGRLELNSPPPCLDRTDAGRRRAGAALVPNDGRTGLVPWLEEEADYLERLGLLLEGEAERLEALDGPEGD
jgi:hypothetical protein